MITVKKIHNFLFDFLLLQGVDLRETEEKVHCELFLPVDALNALMSDFAMGHADKQVTWELDEDNQFVAKYHFVNVEVDIREGQTYSLRKLEGNQEILGNILSNEPVLPGMVPHDDFKRPVL